MVQLLLTAKADPNIPNKVCTMLRSYRIHVLVYCVHFIYMYVILLVCIISVEDIIIIYMYMYITKHDTDNMNQQSYVTFALTVEIMLAY